MRSNARLESNSLANPKIVPFESKVASAVFPKLVSIQFKGRENLELMNQLRAKLEQTGLPGPEPEELKIEFHNTIRYFNAEDRTLAEETAKVVNEFMRAQSSGAYKDYYVILRDFTHIRPHPPAGQIEIWCNPSRKEIQGERF